MWEDTLKVSPIGIQDNFFELGGHSLLAMGLMAQLERDFKAKLPLSALFQAPTVERLAELLRRQDLNPRWSPLVPIQSKGTGPRFFCIAGGVGSVLYYYPLAHCLGPDQPFFGLQSKGINGDCAPYTHVQDMARHYIEGIRSIQPEGPYWLGGHCFGGIVAFEIAQQLAREGQAIALLAVLDIPAPGQDAASAVCDADDATWVLRLGQLLEQSTGKNLGLSLDELRLLDLEEQAQYLKEGMIKAQMLPPGAGTSQVRGLVQVFKANSRARYIPPAQVHPVPIALFRASEYHGDYDYSAADRGAMEGHEATLGWCQYARGPLEVNVVPGNHLTMMWEPHVQGLAECLGATLARTGYR